LCAKRAGARADEITLTNEQPIVNRERQPQRLASAGAPVPRSLGAHEEVHLHQTKMLNAATTAILPPAVT
jgi:hypothetical protein